MITAEAAKLMSKEHDKELYGAITKYIEDRIVEATKLGKMEAIISVKDLYDIFSSFKNLSDYLRSIRYDLKKLGYTVNYSGGMTICIYWSEA